jgi:hypothetical protein
MSIPSDFANIVSLKEVKVAIKNWGKPTVTLAYDRYDRACVVIHNTSGCKVFNIQGFDYEVNTKDKDTSFVLNEEAQNLGLDIYRELRCKFA